MGIEGVENLTGNESSDGIKRVEGYEPVGAPPRPTGADRVDGELDEEQERRQAVVDDHNQQAEQLASPGKLDQGPDSAVDERIPNTGESAEQPDEEQERREAARADSEQQREAFAQQEHVSGALNENGPSEDADSETTESD